MLLHSIHTLAKLVLKETVPPQPRTSPHVTDLIASASHPLGNSWLACYRIQQKFINAIVGNNKCLRLGLTRDKHCISRGSAISFTCENLAGFFSNTPYSE